MERTLEKEDNRLKGKNHKYEEGNNMAKKYKVEECENCSRLVQDLVVKGLKETDH